MFVSPSRLLSFNSSVLFFQPACLLSDLFLLQRYDIMHQTVTRGPFLERPSKLTGPVSHFEIEVSRKVGCVLTSNEVHFVSLAENFTV